MSQIVFMPEDPAEPMHEGIAIDDVTIVSHMGSVLCWKPTGEDIEYLTPWHRIQEVTI